MRLKGEIQSGKSWYWSRITTFNALGNCDLSDGRQYQGEIKDGQPYGEGTINYPSGLIERGTFKNSFLHGIGKYYLKIDSIK